MAEPMLASALWTADLTAERMHTEDHLSRKKLSTGIRQLDALLDGGIDIGNITCVSAETNGRTEDLVLALLSAHLLSSPDSTATVVDTRLSFDVRKLLAHLTRAFAARLEENDERGAMNVLERLRIMKVFDFVGLTESVAELRDSLGRPGQNEDAAVLDQPAAPLPKGTVGDSDEDEDEMLDEPAPLAEGQAIVHGVSNKREQTRRSTSHLLIIDSFTQPVAPLLKTNYVQAQSLMATFLRSLHHLTRTYELAAVLVNTANSYAAQSSAAEPTPSIFSSCTLRPALGRTFTHLLDLHLLLHEVPATADDAKALFGADNNGRIVDMVTVVEVLQDRYSARIGRWSTIPPTD